MATHAAFSFVNTFACVRALAASHRFRKVTNVVPWPCMAAPMLMASHNPTAKFEPAVADAAATIAAAAVAAVITIATTKDAVASAAAAEAAAAAAITTPMRVALTRPYVLYIKIENAFLICMLCLPYFNKYVM